MTRRDRFLLAALVVIGAALRAPTIGEWPLWIDEALSWQMARLSWLDLQQWQEHPDRPPLSIALVRLSIALAGTDAEWALRIPSLLAGTLAIPAGYLLGRSAGSRVAGLALAALIAFDPQFMMQARYARMYSLYILLAALVLTGFAALVRDPAPRWIGWAGLGLGLAAVFWTHSLGLFLWFGILMGGLTESIIRYRRAGPAGAAAPVAGVGLALAIATLLSRPGLDAFWRMMVRYVERRRPGKAGWLETLQAVLQDKFGTVGAEAIGLMVGVAIVVGLIVIARRTPALAVTLATTAVAAGGTALGAGARQGYGAERYTVLFWLVAWACVAVAAYAPRRPSARAMAIVAFGAFTFLLAARSMRLDRPAHHGPGALARQIAASDPAPVRYVPSFLIDLGDYYRLTSWRDGRSPRAWVLIGYSDSLDPALRDTLSIMSRAYDSAWDSAEIDRRLRADHAIAIEFGRDSVRLLSP